MKHLNWQFDDKEKKGDFSVYDWAQNNDSRWIFINYLGADKEIMFPLTKIWINLAILGGLNRNENNDLAKLYLFVDECHSVGKIEKLPDATNMGRKYGLHVCLGYHSDQQLIDLYGPNTGTVIKGNIGNRFIFRASETKDAQDISSFLGKGEVIKASKSKSYGPTDHSDRETLGESAQIKNIVLDSEIRNLPDGHFYLKSLYLDPAKMRIKKQRWPAINGPHKENHCYPSKKDESSVSINKGEEKKQFSIQ